MAELAYLDPGSGSMLLQALLGGIAGVLVAIKLFGRRILGFLRPRSRQAPETPAAGSDEPS